MPLPATLGRAAFEEALPLGLGVERGEGHKQVVLSLRHGQREAIGGEGLPAPLPVQAAIAGERRAAHTDRIMGREADIQPPSGGATEAEGPVEPAPGGIAHVGAEVERVVLDALDEDVAAGKVAIDLKHDVVS